MNSDDWTALKERLQNILTVIAEDSQGYWEPDERARLRGKAQGVKLALSYMEEQERAAGYE
jgi:hypothetical protein